MALTEVDSLLLEGHFSDSVFEVIFPAPLVFMPPFVVVDSLAVSELFEGLDRQNNRENRSKNEKIGFWLFFSFWIFGRF